MSIRLVIVCVAFAGLGLIGAAQDEPKKETVKKDEPKKTVPEKKPDTTTPKPKERVIPEDPIKAAEKVLRDAKVSTDSKSLLEFFRTRTLDDNERLHLLTTIRRLGDDDFDVREQASEALKKAGLGALPILRSASRDMDVEISRRVEICLQSIHQDQETARIVAAARLLAHQKAEGTVQTLLAYLPSVPDDEVVADGIRTALTAYTKVVGKLDPMLRDGLKDKDPARRALAAQVVGEALPSEREAVRQCMSDSDPKVRFIAASTLAKASDVKAIPTMLKLIGEGPVEIAFQVEDMFCQLLDAEEKPPATLSGNDADARKKAQQAWEKWIEAKGEKLKLSRLTDGEPTHGLTLIIEVDGGGVNGGRIWECGPDGKQRWEMTNLGGPVDVQVLPGGRLLIPEYYNSRVTERDREGKILWESPRLTGNTVSAQRLPNGNTLIATMSNVVELTRGKETVATFPAAGGSVFQAIRHRNGHTYVLGGNGISEYGADKKLLRTINVGSLSGWAGFEILSNGNFLVACYSQANRYAEIDAAGKTVWEHSTTSGPNRLDPTRVQRLRNGNTVVAGGNVMMIVEFDRDKKEVWKVATKGRPFGVRRY